MSHTPVACAALLVVSCVPPQPAQPTQAYPTQGAPSPGQRYDEDDDSDDSDDSDDDDQAVWAPPQQGYPQQGGTPPQDGPPQQAQPATGAQVSGPSVRSDDCRVTLIPADIKGGCPVRLVSPAPCETIDLSNGQRYEFAWTTDGVKCETPWTVQAAGNPVHANNYISHQFSTNVQQGISGTGGVLYVSAADLAQLTSDNGLYHWSVNSFYGSRTGSTTFRIRR